MFQHISKVHQNGVKLSVFNDDCGHKPDHKREHYIHIEVTGIFGCVDGIFNANQRGWEGKGDICIKDKGKNRMSYAGRDIGNHDFDDKLVSGKIFKGSSLLPADRPTGDHKLCPVMGDNRTFIG